MGSQTRQMAALRQTGLSADTRTQSILMITVTHPHIPEIVAHNIWRCLISDVLFYSCSCVECLLCIPGVGGGAGLRLQEMMHSLVII